MFKDSLKRHRFDCGMTQKVVAEHLEMSTRAYQHYEIGTREPNIANLIKLADLFNVSLDALVGREFPSETDDG